MQKRAEKMKNSKDNLKMYTKQSHLRPPPFSFAALTKMAAANGTPEISLRTLCPGPDVHRLLQEIKDLGGSRFGKAQAASLGRFCRQAIGGLEAFLQNLAAFKVFRVGNGPDELKDALQRAIHFLTEKCTVKGGARLLAIELVGGQSLAGTETDVKDRITEAVRLHVEVVVKAAKVTQTKLFSENPR